MKLYVASEPCSHPDWRINWWAVDAGETVAEIELHGKIVELKRLTPICVVCGEPVQVGAGPAVPNAEGSSVDAEPGAEGTAP